MSFNESLREEILVIVYTLLTIDQTGIDVYTPENDKFERVYSAILKSELELKDWSFSIKSYKLEKYTDLSGGYYLPGNYIKFKSLGDDIFMCNECTLSSISTSKRTFTMERRDGRLYMPPGHDEHALLHTRIYYVSDDFDGYVSNTFKTIVAYRIALIFANSYKIPPEQVARWDAEYNKLSNECIKPIEGEYQGNRTASFTNPNTYNSIGNKHNKHIRYLR